MVVLTFRERTKNMSKAFWNAFLFVLIRASPSKNAQTSSVEITAKDFKLQELNGLHCQVRRRRRSLFSHEILNQNYRKMKTGANPNRWKNFKWAGSQQYHTSWEDAQLNPSQLSLENITFFQINCLCFLNLLHTVGNLYSS